MAFKTQVTQALNMDYTVQVWLNEWVRFSEHRFRADAEAVHKMFENGDMVETIINFVESAHNSGKGKNIIVANINVINTLLYNKGGFYEKKGMGV